MAELRKMSFKELGKLFPILLEKHNDAWKILFSQEKKQLFEIIGENNIKQIDHYGSTSIPNILAKPIIDILMQIDENIDIDALIKKVLSAGYIYDIYGMNYDNPSPPMLFFKGYTPYGFEKDIFHLHIKYHDDAEDLLFRDYLNCYPKVAKQYERLKVKLSACHRHDVMDYAKGKLEFINQIKCEAKMQFREVINGRYTFFQHN